MKTILFLSDQNRYLETGLYSKLVEVLERDFNCVYFESDFRSGITYDKSEQLDRKKKTEVFEQYLTLGPVQLNTEKLSNPVCKLKRIWGNFFKKIHWRFCFLDILDKTKPDLCIFINPNSPNVKMVCNYRSHITKVWLQPAAIFKNVLEKKGILSELKYKLYESIFRLPILPSKDQGLSNPNIHYLLWSESWINHIKRNRNSAYLAIGSPLFDQFWKKGKCVAFKNRPHTCLIILNKEKYIGRNSFYKYLRFYRKVIDQNPDFNFLVKAHPLGDLDLVKNKLPGVTVIQNNLQPDSVEMVITHWSSLAFQFMVSGVCTILVNPNGEFNFAKRNLEDYKFLVNDIPSANALINRIRNRDFDFFGIEVRKFLRTKLTDVEGESSSQISDYIRGLLN